MVNTLKKLPLTMSGCIVILLSGALSAEIAGERPKVFDQRELAIFCDELPMVLESLRQDEREQYFIDTMLDYRDTIFQREPDRVFPSRLGADRFNYILNHVLLAGILNDMGGFGEAKLAFLNLQKARVQADRNLSPARRNEILDHLERSIERLTRLSQQVKAIPRSELILLWDRKDRLNRLLHPGVVPIKKKKMRAQ